MGTWGGSQPNAGRKLGGYNKATLERRKVEKALHQAIMNKANRLLKIMMAQAEGEMFLFRIDETENKNGKKIREHVMVTDWREIKKFFDECAQSVDDQDDLDGLSGQIEDDLKSKKYYYIKTKEADWRAIESLFDRVFGKSTQYVSTDDGDNENGNYEQLNGEQLDRHIEELRERIGKVKEAQGTGKQDTEIDGTKEQPKE